ncbi:MAG: heme ABC exporter ATP-binding protein CcmA [Polyangiaceae bacterium]|nr:heme ABC exporter ATP-binding protein CcmA [Polyangiaceae bacterium]MCW5790069.1 heme ABC exporter ATP-binding protein CcmA [Polyangiaceae bacterium]
MLTSVEVQGVTRVFGSTLALRGVTVSFPAGAVTVLEGPNGAGKSTLLGIIGTLIQPTSGQVHYPPLKEAAEVRRELGWLGHDSHCYRELTGRENVTLAAGLHGCGASEVQASLERVGATGFCERPVSTLSRGQRQRVALARALVHAPSLLLLDEPSSGLDVASVERLIEVVMEERARGSVVVMVSHSRGIASRIGDRVVRLEAGRVKEG